MTTAPYRQHIPRPAGAVRRLELPWGNLAPDRRRHVPVAAVRAAFPPRDVRDDDVSAVRAAVLTGIVDLDDEAHVLLTRRSDLLERDPGLMAFPGGIVEDGEHPVDAVLREAHEEVGLEPSAVTLWRFLGIVDRARRPMPVAAYLGLVEAESFSPCEDEVDEVMIVPLADLLADGASWEEEWESGGAARVVHFFADAPALGDNVVWGLTARVLSDLLVGVAGAL